MTDSELLLDACYAYEALAGLGGMSDRHREAYKKLRSRIVQSEPEPVKCIVKDCLNHQHEGKFAGDLCSPCHTFITTNEGKYSQAYRNTRREWVGLTAKDLAEIPPSCYEGAIWADAKLKEKNGG